MVSSQPIDDSRNHYHRQACLRPQAPDLPPVAHGHMLPGSSPHFATSYRPHDSSCCMIIHSLISTWIDISFRTDQGTWTLLRRHRSFVTLIPCQHGCKYSSATTPKIDCLICLERTHELVRNIMTYNSWQYPISTVFMIRERPPSSKIRGSQQDLCWPRRNESNDLECSPCLG